MTLFPRQRLALPLNLCLMVVLFVFSTAPLAKTPAYFTASVPVSSQSTSERERAAAQGLREVLIRMSGTTELDTYPQAVAALAKANRHMEQFHYERVRNTDGSAGEHLVMSFAPAVVERVLREARLPYWPVTRPSTLVWLVEDDLTEGRRLVNDANRPVIQGLTVAAQQRGVPLLLPLLDLDDQLAISAEQVWNLEEEAILSASERYAADTILVGRATLSFSGEWWTSWQFFHKGERRNYELRGSDPIMLGQQALGPLADFLASQYALRSSSEGNSRLYVQLSPIADFGAYRKSLDYLQKLAVVTSYHLLAVTDETLLFSFQLSGTRDQFLNSLSLDNKMRARIARGGTDAPWIASAAGTAEQPLQLEWIGR